MMQETRPQTREVHLPGGCGIIATIDVPKDMPEDRVLADFAFGQLIGAALMLLIGVLILTALFLL